MTIAVKLDRCTFYVKIRIWPCWKEKATPNKKNNHVRMWWRVKIMWVKRRRLYLAKIKISRDSAKRWEKKRGKKKGRVTKEESDKNKHANFYAKRIEIKNAYFFTCIWFYFCIRRHILMLMTLIIVFLVFVFLYCRILRTYFLMWFLMNCHLLRELKDVFIIVSSSPHPWLPHVKASKKLATCYLQKGLFGSGLHIMVC